MKTKLFNSCARLFALFCVFALSIGQVWAIDWASLGVAPVANGQYYIYNTGSNYFIVNNGTSTNASLTNNPAIVEGKNFTLNASTQVVIRNSSYNRTCTITAVAATSGYTMSYRSTYTYYFYTNNTTLSYARNSLTSTNYQQWIFIPVNVFNAQKSTVYYIANAGYMAGQDESFGTIQVSENNSTWVSNIDHIDGTTQFGTTATVYYKATATSDMYRFNGWKTSPTAEGYVSTNATYTATFEASTDPSIPAEFTLYADFQKKNTIYAKALTGTNNPSVGSAKVAFSSTIPDNQTEAESNYSLYGDSYDFTAYFSATAPAAGYDFVGWSRNAAGTRMIAGAVERTYSETFTATSTRSDKPTKLEVYAIYEAISNNEAQVVHIDSNTGEEVITPYPQLSAAVSAAAAGDRVQLLKNITLASTQNIGKNIILDLNGYSISGNVTLLNITSNNVTIEDGKQKDANSISLSSSVAAPVVRVSGGTFTFSFGRIDATNSSVGAVLVEGGTFLMEGQGGEITAVAGYGVQVNNGAKATLAQGTINATGSAVGVVANGVTTITHSVKINASGATNIVGVRINNTATIDGGVITATATGANAYAIQAQAGTIVCEGYMEAKASATSGAYALKQEGSAKVTVKTGRFHTNNTQDIIGTPTNNTNLKLNGGYYVHDAALTTYGTSADVKVANLQNNNKFYAAGYRYVLSDGENPNYIAYTANGKGFSTLEEALDYANQNVNTTMTILQVVPEYTLETPGNYTLPAKATLLIPYKKDQTPQTTVERTKNTPYVTPSEFRKLIFATGVHLDVLGTIEVGCKQSEQGQTNSANGAPTGPFGWLYLSEGSQIVVSDGGKVRAWGFITGPGGIDIRRGGVVWEQFQILDFKGGSITSALINDRAGKGHRLFPISEYFIQNIESKTTYHPGAKLFTQSAFYMSAEVLFNSIQIIGVYNRKDKQADDIAMFLMDDADNSDDTWVRKSYDVMTDYQVYEINSSAKLGSMTISGGGTNMNSQDYDMPITHNMKIHLLTGKMDIGQRTVLLPGAKIEIDKQSTVVVVDKSNITYDGALFLYDANEWGKYIHNNSTAGSGYYYYAQKVKYTPSIGEKGGTPTARWSGEGGTNSVKPASASINVKGILEIQGAIYTTTSGANIYSSNEDAGTVHFLVAAANDGSVYHANDALATSGIFTKSLTNDNVADVCTSAKLKNGDGSYTLTKDSAAAGDSYCYINGAWRKLKTEDCLVHDEVTDKYFAKPQDYVELDKQRDTKGAYKDLCIKEDHTYDYVVEWDKKDSVLICMDDCQWWKVVPTAEDPTVFHCTHPENNTYYIWNGTKWVEKKLLVTWLNANGDFIDQYELPYKSLPKYNGSTPQLAMTDTYIYDFKGWTPKLTALTEDATYTAVYGERLRKYFITFRDAEGVIESKQWEVGSTPVCVNVPAPAGKILQWEPAIHAVTGEQTYTATYLDEEPTEYSVTFVNYDWDGNMANAIKTGMVAVGEIPTPPETNPTKTDNKQIDKEFEFDGWEPDLAPVSANVIYVAKFKEVTKKFNISFRKNGKVLQSGKLAYGTMPVPPALEYEGEIPEGVAYYEAVWDPQVATVTSDQVYEFDDWAPRISTCLFNLVAGENGKVKLGDEAAAASASTVADYGTPITIAAIPNTNYVFAGWSDGNMTAERTINIKNTTLRAEFALAQYTITWKDHNGSRLGTTTVTHGETPSYTAPVRDADVENSYTFAGWNTTKETPGNGIVAATANATYFATYTSEPVQYTLRFIFDNGREDFVKNYGYNAEPTIANPTKTSLMGIDYVFTGWKNNATGVITPASATTTLLPAVTADASYTAQYKGVLEAGGDVAEELVLDDPTTLDDLIIHTNGSVEAYNGAPLVVNNLYLEADVDAGISGQLFGSNITAADVFFDLTLNVDRRHWKAFGVPFEIGSLFDTKLLYQNDGETSWHALTLGRDYDIVYYNGETRASAGAGAQCWEYVEYNGGTLTPGKAYMIAFTKHIDVVRFVKKTGAPLNYTGSADLYDDGDNSDKDANWNGIANPKTFHALLDAGTALGYVHDGGEIGSDGYTPYEIENGKYIVGKAVYVQVPQAQSTVAVTRADESDEYIQAQALARRAAAKRQTAGWYKVAVAAEGGEAADKVYLLTEEDKADTYHIGKDLAKFNMSTKYAHIWVNRYDNRLTMNTTAPVDGIAEYPIGLYAPAAGEYTISLQSSPATETLYLTKDGEVIWNLSDGAYTLILNSGITEGTYGLRLGEKKAPEVATGFGEAVVDAHGKTTKVLIDGKVFIIREDRVYTIDGQLVK